MPDVTDTSPKADNIATTNQMDQNKTTEGFVTKPSDPSQTEDPVAKLKEFGFLEDRIFYALQVTSGGFQPALEWLINHADEDLTELPPPNSIKCSICGKLFSSVEEAQKHAEDLGHQDFATSAPETMARLSEAEKSAKLAQLKVRLADKRKVQEATAMEQAKLAELLRRKQGKELAEVREQQELQEMRKIMADRRKEKAEDRKAREKILAQIEEDRRVKQSRDKETKEEEQRVQQIVMTSAPAAITDQVRIQIRLPESGMAVPRYTLDSKSTLKDLKEKLVKEHGLPSHKLVLMTTFPVKTFEESEMTKTLAELGLCPSATLIARLL